MYDKIIKKLIENFRPHGLYQAKSSLLDKGRVAENLQKEWLCYFIIFSSSLWKNHFSHKHAYTIRVKDFKPTPGRRVSLVGRVIKITVYPRVKTLTVVSLILSTIHNISFVLVKCFVKN